MRWQKGVIKKGGGSDEVAKRQLIEPFARFELALFQSEGETSTKCTQTTFGYKVAQSNILSFYRPSIHIYMI